MEWEFPLAPATSYDSTAEGANDMIEERLQETIDWIDSKLGDLATNDKERYVDFEWLKSHLISIRDNENRSLLK